MFQRISMFLFLLPFFPTTPAWAQLQASLNGPSEFGDAQSVVLEFTLRNTTGSTLQVLKWGTPFEGFTADVFRVTRDGRSLVYEGIATKRIAPVPTSYLAIDGGDQISVQVPLGNAYDLSKAGTYGVQFRANIHDVTPLPASSLTGRKTSDFNGLFLESNRITFSISGAGAIPLLRQQGRARLGFKPSPKFADNCTEEQKKIIREALADARRLAKKATLCLKKRSPKKPDDTYTEWFGEADKARYRKVKKNFKRITFKLKKKKLTFNCDGPDCEEDWLAYVFPNDKSCTIYLCPGFYDLDEEGLDSRAGTLIHEASHFNKVAGTDDIVYGPENARRLARDRPGDACRNADNYEYFAESKPCR